MFTRSRPHKRTSSNSTNATATPVSPLQSPTLMSFDFEFAGSRDNAHEAPPSPFSPISEGSISRPRTSHGVVGGKPAAGLQLLPSIPRVASRRRSSDPHEAQEGDGGGGWDSRGGQATGQSRTRDNGSSESAMHSQLSFEQPVDVTPTGFRAMTAVGGPSSTAGSTPRMESSLFPAREAHTAASSPVDVMSRSFIDSRDKPYAQPARPFLTMQPNHSSPDLSMRQPPTATPIYSPVRNWGGSPQASMQNLSTSSRTTFSSGTTARPSTQASSSTAHSTSNVVTIGTPYQATADSFPLPQLVRTRPKTPGATATVAGVSVPTHHTSATKTGDKSMEPKKKGRLRNPLALLQRRRTSQDSELVGEGRSQRQAQAQALARQRDVMASGVNKPPPDFDPRIRGRVVHDFSAPRGKRNTFDEMDMLNGFQGAGVGPSFLAGGHPPRDASLTTRGPGTDTEQRRSVHTPVFVEHLSENPEGARRISSLQAENLENKDFLHRASKHSSRTNYSQESAVLPPFARRSQTLDPMQASFCLDDESKRSSDRSSEKDRDSTLGGVSEVSPILALSNKFNVEARASTSPVSPSGSGQSRRHSSETSKAIAQPWPVSEASKLSSQRAQTSSAISPDVHRENVSEVNARSPPVSLAVPIINTIAETSAENFPVDPLSSSSHEPRALTRGFPFHKSGSPSPMPEGWSVPKTQAPKTNLDSPATQSLLERTAGMSTPERTPELELVGSIQMEPNTDQPKLVEKRASAVGHSRKSSGGPKHHASNASRFSFQFGNESAAQEQALEEKHRRMQSREIAQSMPRGRSPDEDEDDEDYFDEDAMDDMDEIEMQTTSPVQFGAHHHESTTQSSRYLQQAREALQHHDSDESSVDNVDDTPDGLGQELVAHPDRLESGSHSARGSYSRHSSYMQGGQDEYWRGSTIDHYMRDSLFAPQDSRIHSQASDFNFDFASHGAYTESSQEHSLLTDNIPTMDQYATPRSNFYMQPNLAVQAESSPTQPRGPPIPSRDSGNSERNRIVSGISFDQSTSTPSSEPLKLDVDGAAIADRHHPINAMSFSSVKGGVSPLHKAKTSVSRSEYMTSPSEMTSETQSATLSTRSSGTPGTTRITSGWSLRSPLSSPQIEHDGDQNVDGMSLTSPTKSVRSPRNEPSQDLYSQGDNDSTNATNLVAPLRSVVTHTHSNSIDDVGLSSATNSFSEQSKAAPGQQSITRKPRKPLAASTTPGPSVSTGSDFHGTSPRLPISRNEKAEPTVLTSPLSGNSIPPAVPTTMNSFGDFDFGDDSHQESALAGSSVPPHGSMRTKSKYAHPSEAYTADDLDDMYFDDGNFDRDIDEPHNGSIDENAFDDDGFLARPGMMKAVNHRRDNSAMTFTSVSSEGPYPTFAMPNAARTSQRLSQMMLEDLPLQAPVDPRYIPQRNPSEDMKRLGLSDRVPPVPVPESNKEAFSRMQSNLHKYHAVLAEAANKAASDGRFLRAPSISTPRSSASRAEDNQNGDAAEIKSLQDDGSVYSNGEDGGEIAMPYTNGKSNVNIERSNTNTSHLTHLTDHSPPKMSFDFGFDEPTNENDDMFGHDDDLVAAANAEALASDDEGFYGQEFDFYGRPRANSGDPQAINGGFFGEDGEMGLTRNKSLKEPNLTPITERSEFSTRNSFVGGQFGPVSAGPFGPHSPALARMPVSPLIGSEVTSFDELRRLKANAFGESSSLRSHSNRSSSNSLQAALSPSGNARISVGQNYFGGTPMQLTHSNDSSVSSNHVNTQQGNGGPWSQDSPLSAGSSGGLPFTMDVDSTPKKSMTNSQSPEPMTARKVPPLQTGGHHSHIRKGSGADSVTYVREPDPENHGKPRWVLERRRTSEQGQLELVGRELVQGGWI